MKVFLDTGVLTLVAHPNAAKSAPFLRWMREQAAAGVNFGIPEVCDYELRREFLRCGKRDAIAHLDKLREGMEFHPVSSEVWKRAAEVWAESHNMRKQFADDKALDCDALLIATAQQCTEERVIVATSNPRHIGLFLDARSWDAIGLEA